jgi:hypothetical protein
MGSERLERKAYHQQLEAHLQRLDVQLQTEWSSRHDQLDGLSARELAAANQQLLADLAKNRQAIPERIANRTIEGWVNFLAQAMHGAGPAWDHTQPNGGARALRLAHSKTLGEDDPTRDNVNPMAMDALLASGQPTNHARYGILEIHLDANGRLVEGTGYGMRLDHVSEGARAYLRTMGRVRDLAVNKVVRLCSRSIDPPTTIAAVLITADGYVRRTNWGELEHARIPHGDLGAWDACFDDLIDGKESEVCHHDHAQDDPDIVALAERAQDLSLQLIGGRS